MFYRLFFPYNEAQFAEEIILRRKCGMSVILLFKGSEGEVISHAKLISKLSVGRSSRADVPLKDDLVSSSHGVFERQSDGRITYNDLGSKNGTYLNGTLTSSCYFKIMDCLRLGSVDVTLDESDLSRDERMKIGYRRVRRMKDLTLLKDFKKRQKREGTTKVFIRFRK